jgi:hypothetical protein
VIVLCCQVEVPATGWSLVQRSPTECGVSECDREASIMRRPWPTRGCRASVKKCMHIICECGRGAHESTWTAAGWRPIVCSFVCHKNPRALTLVGVIPLVTLVTPNKPCVIGQISTHNPACEMCVVCLPLGRSRFPILQIRCLQTAQHFPATIQGQTMVSSLSASNPDSPPSPAACMQRYWTWDCNSKHTSTLVLLRNPANNDVHADCRLLAK